jgi:ADP-ribose pyrophosphatase YjhB (NUDIX family)
MKFCSDCGSEVEFKIPDDDNRPRYVCTSCKTIHYQNPNIVAGTLPIYENKILLCKRAIEPRYGYWTLPAGFMENQETTVEAACRETLEEADAQVQNLRLYTVISVPQIDQVHIYFLADLVDGKFGVGPESLECQLFAEENIPWDDISFPTVKKTLKLYLKDKQRGQFDTHVTDIIREPREVSFPVYKFKAS